jgi:formylglycine-generating enzyme required for sulfatase activity
MFKVLPISLFLFKSLNEIMTPIRYFIFFTFVLVWINLQANNLQITNLTYDANANTVNFDISWKSGFYASPFISDHVYIFIKYRNSNSSAWNTMTFPAAGHSDDNPDMSLSIDSQSPINSSTNERIAMRASHTGSFTSGETSSNCTVKLSDQITLVEPSFKVFGIEMVQSGFATTDPYYLGDGISANRFHQGDDTSLPFYYDGSPSTIQVGTGAADINTTSSTPIPVNSIYFRYFWRQFNLMRYEISQGQYLDFLNCLSRTGQNEHTDTDISGISISNTFVMSNSTTMTNRNGIRCDSILPNGGPITFFCDYNENGIPNENGDGQNIAANFLLPKDLLAYLDWAGLSPMNEAQFEWYCRGPELPVPGEYAWGSTVKTSVTFLNGPTIGKNNEIPLNIGADGLYKPSGSPMRTGATATASTNRVQAGASYFGAMDLTGNVAELVIGSYSVEDFEIYNPNFSDGDGSLDIFGNHNQNWPSNMTTKGKAPSLVDLNSVSHKAAGSPYVSNTIRDAKNGGRGIY